ncbi:MAG TPA: hypothetical protein VIJ82_08870 [Streptosporangiaceae bacterium]|jgi:hypothetical protein
MPDPSLITDYLGELSAQLPASIVEELADGLDQTCQHYLDRGLDLDAAAGAALAEFGEPQVIVAAFTRLSPARRAARRLLFTGPVVGACWGTALITSRAWTWPGPSALRLLFGLSLITIIGLLAAAAFGRQYQPVGRAGTAGCAGIAMLDTAILITVAVALPAVSWLVMLGVAASGTRLAFTVQALRPVLDTQAITRR